MTVEIERTFLVDAPIEAVWETLSDERIRAQAIDIVVDFDDDGDETIWTVELPGPLHSRTMAVKTHDIERDPPRYVRFVGHSKLLNVTGEHELTETESGCRVRNRFVVDGSLPGVEQVFRRNIDDEITNIMDAVPSTVTPVENTES